MARCCERNADLRIARCRDDGGRQITAGDAADRVRSGQMHGRAAGRRRRAADCAARGKRPSGTTMSATVVPVARSILAILPVPDFDTNANGAAPAPLVTIRTAKTPASIRRGCETDCMSNPLGGPLHDGPSACFAEFERRSCQRSSMRADRRCGRLAPSRSDAVGTDAAAASTHRKPDPARRHEKRPSLYGMHAVPS